MAIQVLQAAAGLARSAITCKVGGLWQVVRTHLEGRNAVNFERERRATLLTVPPVLPPGTCLHDQRADGSILKMHLPGVTHIDVTLGGNMSQSIPQGAVPAVRPPEHGSIPGNTGAAQIVEE